MKKKNIKSPIEVLVVVCNRKDGSLVAELLENNHIYETIIFNGEGTMVPDISSLFGFGITERDIVVAFINSDLSAILVETIYNDLKLNLHETGLVFTLGLSSITKQLLSTFNINVGE